MYVCTWLFNIYKYCMDVCNASIETGCVGVGVGVCLCA